MYSFLALNIFHFSSIWTPFNAKLNLSSSSNIQCIEKCRVLDYSFKNGGIRLCFEHTSSVREASEQGFMSSLELSVLSCNCLNSEFHVSAKHLKSKKGSSMLCFFCNE